MQQKVSCITICKNNLQELIMTIDSAIRQSLYEIVIIDGDSTDGTPSELPSLKTKIEKNGIVCTVLSEPDTGIYNAMNKGIQLSTGDWLIFMNSGDKFTDQDVIKKIFCRDNYEDIDVLYCDYSIRIGDKVKQKKCLELNDITNHWIGCHQAFIVRRDKMVVRPYQEKYRYCADYEWFLHFYLVGGRFKHIEESICVSDRSGVSSREVYQCCLETIELKLDNGIKEPVYISYLKKIYSLIYEIVYCNFILR